MASINNNFKFSGYGLKQPLLDVFPAPIVAKRAPTANDLNYPLGQGWVFPANNAFYVLTSVANGAATWETLTGGAGVFTSLTVNPGPTNLSTVGNGAVNIGNAANTQAVTLTAGVGNLSIVGAGHTITIGQDAAANQVFLGSVTNGALTTISGGNTAVDAILLQTAAAGGIQIGLASQTGAISLGNSTAGQTVNIANAAGANTVNIVGAASTVASTINIGTGNAPHNVVIGSTNATAGSITVLQSGVQTNITSPILQLGPTGSPIFFYVGAGAPGAGLAVHVGDLYVNTTAASAVTRMYIASAVGTWVNITCSA